MKIKILNFLILFILLILSIKFSFAGNCKYMGKWNRCIEANNNGTVRSIDAQTDFLCRETDNIEKQIYNIILDEKFKPIDKEANKELEEMEKKKNMYFGREKKASFLKGFDLIEKRFGLNGYYYAKYLKSCGEFVEEGVSCIEEKLGVGSYNRSLVDTMNKGTCITFLEAKVNTRRNVAYDIMLLNKQAVKRNEMKKYEQLQRTKYSDLFDAMMINLGYWMRIAQKWPSKTKNPHQ